MRLLDESSRYTPETDSDSVDIGFVGRGRNRFVGVARSTTGSVDIFAHDFVLRCPRRYAGGNAELEVNTIGSLAIACFEGGAFSAGPMLNATDFNDHPINRDASPGSRPPALDNPLARTVSYKTEDGLSHIRLLDGRPGSHTFTGVTPSEAVQQILSEGKIEWGCFLDSGQTAKICVSNGQKIVSYGNRHYMRWPTERNPVFSWRPETGRPVANVLAL